MHAAYVQLRLHHYGQVLRKSCYGAENNKHGTSDTTVLEVVYYLFRMLHTRLVIYLYGWPIDRSPSLETEMDDSTSHLSDQILREWLGCLIARRAMQDMELVPAWLRAILLCGWSSGFSRWSTKPPKFCMLSAVLSRCLAKTVSETAHVRIRCLLNLCSWFISLLGSISALCGCAHISDL